MSANESAPRPPEAHEEVSPEKIVDVEFSLMEAEHKLSQLFLEYSNLARAESAKPEDLYKFLVTLSFMLECYSDANLNLMEEYDHTDVDDRDNNKLKAVLLDRITLGRNHAYHELQQIVDDWEGSMPHLNLSNPDQYHESSARGARLRGSELYREQYPQTPGKSTCEEVDLNVTVQLADELLASTDKAKVLSKQ